MLKKFGSMAILCMLCSSFLPSLTAGCPSCEDCDNDKNKSKSINFTVIEEKEQEQKNNSSVN